MIGVTIEHMSVAFPSSCAIDDLTMTVAPTSWVGVIGPNGAGKTTLLRALAGLERFRGDVFLSGERITGIAPRRLARMVAFVPQRPLIPEGMSVTDYLLLGRTPYIRPFGVEGPADLRIVARLVDGLDLTALSRRPLGTLSGGELQRVVLGRALAQDAPLLLLDEPTSALDMGNQQKMLELVDSLRARHGLTVISAMHDLTLAGQFADSLVLLSGGRCVVAGLPPDVLTEPTIRTHLGASVRILHHEDGVQVVPRRASSSLADASP